MKVRELIEALQALDMPEAEVKLSGDSFAFGDGNEFCRLRDGPTIQNVSLDVDEYGLPDDAPESEIPAELVYAVIWPDCSWPEAIDYAEKQSEDA